MRDYINDIKTKTEFIENPDTVAIEFGSEDRAREAMTYYPDIKMLLSNPLYDGTTFIYINRYDLHKVLANAPNINRNIYPGVLALLNTHDLEQAGIMQVQRQQYLNLKGNGVLLGFVDTGIDYTQNAFRYEDGSSKIQYIWDQTVTGKPPRDFFYGSEYTKAEIDLALSQNDFDSVPHKDDVGHGTFLASVACGRETGEHVGAAPDAGIIAVKMRRARHSDMERFLVPRDAPNAFSSDDFMLGIQYILDRALELDMPVAICVAVGTNLGGHDGFSNFEAYLSRVAEMKGVALCAAAGNEAQSGHHTQGRIAKTGEKESIEILAGDKHEDIYIAIWNYALDRISVSVKSPAGEEVAREPAKSGARHESKLILEKSSVVIEYLFPIENSGSQLTRVKLLSATPGIWTITLYGDSVLDGIFHAWLPITGFVDPGTAFLKPIPNYTVTLPASAVGLITCGNYDGDTNGVSPSSSWGTTRLPFIKPDIAAPGVNVGGVYPTGYGRMSGTSVSAAIAAGAAALLLQWGIVLGNNPAIDSYRIRSYLISGCDRDADKEYPNAQWGYGKLNLFNTFKALR